MKTIVAVDAHGAKQTLVFSKRADVGSNCKLLVKAKPTYVSIDGGTCVDIASGLELTEEVLLYAYEKDKERLLKEARNGANPDYYIFRGRPTRKVRQLKDASGITTGVEYDSFFGNKEVVSVLAQVMVDFGIENIEIGVVRKV